MIEAIRQRASLHIYSSPVLLEELADVVARPAMTRRLAAIGKTAQQAIADYLEAIELVEPAEVPRITRDADDDHVLACALAAAADLIVSGDTDLLALETCEDIPILTPSAALHQVEAQP